MAWSTREIADLAGTSLRAVRHYHEVGLLAEPERLPNGYKQYGVAHLVRLLRVKRLVDLGFSLAQIAEMGDDDHHPEQALRTLDAELAATVEQLQRVRIELGLLLRHRASTDLPAGLVPTAGLSDADRSLVVVMTRVLGPQRLEAYTELLRSATTDPTDGEFDELPADAAEAVRRDLADRMAPYIRRIREEHSALASAPGTRPEDRLADETAAKAVQELYNPAQLDVLRRVRDLLKDG
ncbi:MULTISPECIES: MerR family transcriptional regulator [Pseudonocardia]|uniref:Mercuric resistance operon regulatory protein n=2 Tax=Pseudonocardia TaxID=1847 RepID=A0A1Y2MUK4_PSEAH|nr:MULTISPECIES: MerR family transcriptional regulator [Pseudonocardia]OSY38876.1 Mercuric resistance operon regulatory protein [Pseudonocardia autotrophica]TDN76132.1 DNA-binding transcriptional MerR regulator [Pseudonocardia autotrophica]BBG00113.1 transcriptional regulator, MerR family protein [Pseudonocardia autotrophica]GEC26078.1 transcriptional regulator, MerR family protein [Pseudonocardia saturnea]